MIKHEQLEADIKLSEPGGRVFVSAIPKDREIDVISRVPFLIPNWVEMQFPEMGWEISGTANE